MRVRSRRLFALQISDPAVFAEKAKGRIVALVRTPSYVPTERRGRVLYRAAMQMDYSLEFRDPKMGDTTWTYREVVLNGESPRLLPLLDPEDVAIVRRTGSV